MCSYYVLVYRLRLKAILEMELKGRTKRPRFLLHMHAGFMQRELEGSIYVHGIVGNGAPVYTYRYALDMRGVRTRILYMTSSC